MLTMHKTIYYYTGCKYKIKVAKLNWSALTFCWALGQAPVVWFPLSLCTCQIHHIPHADIYEQFSTTELS